MAGHAGAVGQRVSGVGREFEWVSHHVIFVDAYDGWFMRTIEWRDGRAWMIDQTLLPHAVVVLEIATVDAMIDAIKRLAIRGAPALGAAGGFGVAIAALAARERGEGHDAVRAEASRLADARPTAVNLSWGVRRVLAVLDDGVDAVIDEANRLADEDVESNRAMGELGADLLMQLCGVPLRVLTHCNTGALACVDWGTALGVVRTLHHRGHVREVFADETRPLLQGSRLTTYELAEMGVAHRVVVDGAGPSVIARGLVDVVIVGADRIAANGDTANKIGTYPLALAAQRAAIPFVVAAPESTLDLSCASGALIEIEERDPAEVLTFGGNATAPSGTDALNLAFDVTPRDLITAIVTDRRVIRPTGMAIELWR
jgi:methylthioribose-1-phosphate isomerase